MMALSFVHRWIGRDAEFQLTDLRDLLLDELHLVLADFRNDDFHRREPYSRIVISFVPSGSTRFLSARSVRHA